MEPAPDTIIVDAVVILLLSGIGIMLFRIFRCIQRRHLGLPPGRLPTWAHPEVADVLVTLACVQIGVMLAAGALFSRGIILPLSVSVIIQGLMFHGLAYGLIRWRLHTRGRSWTKDFRPGELPPDRMLAAGLTEYLTVFPVCAAGAIATSWILDRTGMPTAPQTVVSMFLDPESNPFLLSYVIILAVIVAPFVEETLFRGILFPFLLEHFRLPTAVLVSSVIFGMAHFHLASFVPLTVIGAAAALSYVRHRDLGVAVVMHALFNSISIILLIALREV